MADISAIKLPDNTSYTIKDAHLKGIYAVKGTQTAATGSWTGVIDAPALFDGMTIAYYLPYAGSGNATLNLTLSGGGTTGAKNVYYANATRATTHYGAGSTILLTYWSKGSISVAGTATSDDRWTSFDYNANDPNYRHRIYYGASFTVPIALYRYQLLVHKSDTQLTPFNSVSNDTGTSKTLITDSFDPFKGIYYYNSTTTINASASIGNSVLYDSWELLDLRYSFNTGTTLTAKKAVYIVCTPQSDGKVKLASTPIAQEVPSTENGLIYIYLGHAYDTYRIELMPEHPIYQYKNGRIQSWTGQIDDNYWQYNSTTDSIELVFPS